MKTSLSILLLLVLSGCQFSNSSSEKLQTYSGMALGTDYQLKFFAEDKLKLDREIDSVFEVINHSMSTYQEDSDISRLNAGDTSIVVDQMFRDVFELSDEIYKKTEGYFDPSVGNIVNAYGFGPKGFKHEPDSVLIDSLMRFVGFDKLQLTSENKVVGDFPETFLDFNGIAKGYAVDILGQLLEAYGVQNYLAEIGGEIRTKGKNLQSGKTWRLGIDDPRIETNPMELSGVVELKNQSLATSGNYRKYRYDSITKQKFVHIIDPKSGYMKKQNILSVSVIADNVAKADAYATAFMAMGTEKAKAIAEHLSDIEIFLIYDEHGELKTYLSKGFEKAMLEQS